MDLESRCFIPNRGDFDNIGLLATPYDVSPEIVDAAHGIAADIVTEEGKARALYYWFIDNFKLDYSKSRYYSYQNASQAFISRRGRCVDFSFLYTTMARVVGLESCLVDVYRDGKNKRIDHVCSGVYLNDQLVFVDLNYDFGVKHRNYRVLDEEETMDFYDCCVRANNGEKNAFSKFSLDDESLVLDILAFLFRRRLLYVAVSLGLTFNFTNGYDFDFKFDIDSMLNTDVTVDLNKNSGNNLNYSRQEIEEELTDGRAKRFQSMLSELRVEYSFDNRLNNLEYNQDNFLFVSGLFIEYLKRNNVLLER